jgi:hypothetical protein
LNGGSRGDELTDALQLERFRDKVEGGSERRTRVLAAPVVVVSTAYPSRRRCWRSTSRMSAASSTIRTRAGRAAVTALRLGPRPL